MLKLKLVECKSERYLECPKCLTYSCECKFSTCEKCNIKHCFYGDSGNKCGRVIYTKTRKEIYDNMMMEFEYRDWVSGFKGKPEFHCRVNVEKTKCSTCSFEGWSDTSSFEECNICKETNCCNCLEDSCELCGKYLCKKHEMKPCPCECG